MLKTYNSSVILFPSYVETVGLPLLEAKELNRIILASNCPFSKEILEDYPNGYIFSYKNHHELTELMKKVIDGEIIKKEIEKNNTIIKNNWFTILDIINQIRIKEI